MAVLIFAIDWSFFCDTSFSSHAQYFFMSGPGLLRDDFFSIEGIPIENRCVGGLDFVDN